MTLRLRSGQVLLIASLVAAAPPPQPTTLEQMAAICRLPGQQAIERLKTLPEQAQLATVLYCAGYQQGQMDLIRVLRGTPGEARKIAWWQLPPEAAEGSAR